MTYWDMTPADQAPPEGYVRCMICGALVEHDWIRYHSEEECDIFPFEVI